MAIPQSMDYSQKIDALPECNNFEVTLVPTTGAGTYAPGSTIRFDFQQRGFIDPSSICLRYKYTLTAAIGAEMIATPAFTPFLRLETFIGSQNVESINQYNQVAGFLWANTNMDVAMKYGQQSAFGYNNNTTVPTLETLDGRICALNEVGTFSCPLVGLLSSSAKLIPAFAMPQISVQLTMDSIANMFTATGAVPTAFVISNIELAYNLLDFGREMEQMVLSMPRLFLKCNSYSNSSASVANATNGSISLVYNQRLSSIKAAFILPTGQASTNKWGDSFDCTSSNGEYSLIVGGVSYPQRPLSTLNNKTYVLQELRKAVGDIYDKANNMAINGLEFNIVGAGATTYITPAKFIIGIPLEKLHIPTDQAILTGISSNNSSITVNINTATAVAQATTVNLILNYDAIIEVDTANRNATIRQ
jgi:hypothetical protein